jgi:hypothetical protein
MAGCADHADMHGVKGAAKIALISAVDRSPLQPHITVDDFAIRQVIARWLARVIIQNIALFATKNCTERHVSVF